MTSISVRRETAGAYLKAAGIRVRAPGWTRRAADPKPAIQASTDSAPVATAAPWPPPPGRSPQASACEPYREWIEQAAVRRRDAVAIWRDLVDDHGFAVDHAHTLRTPHAAQRATTARIRSSSAAVAIVARG